MRKLTILYGSQTGTAQDVAERICRESVRYYFQSCVSSMNDYSLEKLMVEKLVVFVASTTGQGEDPDNMKCFFQTLWINRQNKSLLRGLNYAVLGLGDSSYQKFNYASKRLNKLLHFLGATQIINIGLADDMHDLGPDFVIDSWLKNLWTSLLSLYPLPNDIEPMLSCPLIKPRYEICYLESKDIHNCDKNSHYLYAEDEKIYSTVITLNLRKTSNDHFQDVRLIEFNLGTEECFHNPGDVAMIQPQNSKEHVEEFLEIIGIDPNKIFTIKPGRDTKLPSLNVLPQPCTVRQCVKTYFDIMSVPKRFFFELLSYFATDEIEKEKFLEFTSSEGQEDLYNYCNRPKRTILEVLADFPHTKTKIPFEYLFDLIPPIKPRAYSIASSANYLPGKIQILMAVVEYKTILKRPRVGLCSKWLAHLNSGSVVPLWIKRGTLTFPDASKGCPPVIMIGPGTGSAPFRAYIQERISYKNYDNLVLIFGSRGKEKDFFFKDEWEDLHSSNKLSLFCAFSRDQEDKIYVQHVMKENYTYLGNLIVKDDTKIYYAGNAKRIPIDVYDALQYICQKYLNLTSTEAGQYMKQNLDKRYQTESWV